jgi:hypothetical protein
VVQVGPDGNLMVVAPGSTSCHALRKALPGYPPSLPLVVYSSANLNSEVMKKVLEFFSEGNLGGLAQYREALCSALRAVDQPELPGRAIDGCALSLRAQALLAEQNHIEGPAFLGALFSEVILGA